MLPRLEITPEDVGVCLSTLVANPREVTGDDVERAFAACRSRGVKSVVTGLSFVNAVGADRLRELSLELDISIRGVEAIVAWAGGAEAAAAEMRKMADIASTVGAEFVMAATIAPDLDRQQAVAGFSAACEVAGQHGLAVDLEFIPRTAVPDLATAWRIVRDSRAENAGLVIDCLHWLHQPGGPDIGLLKTVPVERVHYVQLCDSPVIETPDPGEYIPFSLTSRALPGEGRVDIAELLAALGEIHANPYFALEVYNTELAGTGPGNALEAMLRAVRALVR